jgi:hypothetical protein
MIQTVYLVQLGRILVPEYLDIDRVFSTRQKAEKWISEFSDYNQQHIRIVTKNVY